MERMLKDISLQINCVVLGKTEGEHKKKNLIFSFLLMRKLRLLH